MVSSHFDTHDDRYLNDPEFKKVCDEENRRKFKERQAMEEPEPTSGFRIIVPCVEPLLTRFLHIPCTTRAQPVHSRPYPHCALISAHLPGTGSRPSGCPSTTAESGLTCVCRTSTMDGWMRTQTQVRSHALSPTRACLERL